MAAAKQIKKRIGPLHARVISFLQYHYRGATDEEMQAGIPMAANTQRPRRRELQLMGIIVDSGRVKLTESGREAVVWTLAKLADKEEEQRAAR